MTTTTPVHIVAIHLAGHQRGAMVPLEEVVAEAGAICRLIGSGTIRVGDPVTYR